MRKTKEVRYDEYIMKKTEFLKWLGEWRCDTSQIDEYGCYRKTYYGAKGCWHESISPRTEIIDTECEAHGIMVKLTKEVHFIRTEFWNSYDSRSFYMYEVC